MHIHAPRDDLTGIDGAASLIALTAPGHNVGSLAGLETMTSLRSLAVLDMDSPDLSALAALPELSELVLQRLTGSVDYSPLEHATNLRRLVVTPEYPEGAAGLARIDFGQLRRLRHLELGGGYFELEVAIGIGWLEQLTELETLDIWNFIVDRDALTRSTLPPRLRWLRIDVNTSDEHELLRAAFPGIEIVGDVYEREPPVVVEPNQDFGPLMDIDEFWSLIARSREAATVGDEDAQAQALEALLRGRSHDDLAAFERQYRAQLRRAYRWDLWGAGYVINGGMGDSSFDYFCDFLIGCGRDIFERAVADPDGLVEVSEVMDGSLHNELLRYAVYEAHLKDHGAELPISMSLGEPAGEEWDEDGDDLPTLLPRLCAEEGWSGD
jgi:Protein of unknown function (DUF4240)